MANLKTEAMDLKFKNPIIAASGTFGFGEEFSQIYDLSILGGICSKGLTLTPRSGNKGIRLWETPMGLMNSIGLENPGVDKFITEELPRMKTYNTIIFANLGGHCEEDYLEGIYKLNDTNVDAVELTFPVRMLKAAVWLLE